MVLNPTNTTQPYIKVLILLLSIILLSSSGLITGCVTSQQTQPIVRSTAGSYENIEPANPQPTESTLSKGLLPRFHAMYSPHSLDPTGQGAFTGRKGTIGKPVSIINLKRGDNNIFGSGQASLIGVELTGFIHFPVPGKYTFRALVNDAVRMFIGGKMVLNDPQFGGDRYAGPSEVEIKESGFYEFKVQYYQRKGTSALQLFWKTPPGGDFEIVPPEAYFHKPA